jgi:serine/threonine protein kinase
VHEGTQILYQCLSALTYLHGLEPPIIHRDIKPANILVRYRYAGSINVKFGDFGLSRDTRDPRTICGTWTYLAPEMWNEADRRHANSRARSYTPAVDIWSLGVTVCECVYGLPEGKAKGVDWCQVIVKRLARDYHYADQLQQFLCDEMLIITPSLRGSAESCYNQALLLGDAPEDHCQTPTPASIQYNLASQCHATDEYGGDQQTVLLQDAAIWPGDSQEQDSVDSAEIRRHQRSDAPPPSSQMFGNAASQITNYDSWATWTGWAIPVTEGHHQIVHNNRGAGRAAQAWPEHPSWTVVPPSSRDLDALLDLRAEADIPLKQTQKRSSSSSDGKSRKRQHNQEYCALPEVAEWDGLWQEQLDIPGSLDEGYDGQGYDGQGFEASAEAASDPRRASWEEEQTEEPALTDSEAEMAAALLNAMRGDTELRHCV